MSETQDELQTSPMETAQPLPSLAFICLPSPWIVIVHFLPEFLLQQICREKCTHCSVTKGILETEKALFKENMTFRWKSNFACCF